MVEGVGCDDVEGGAIAHVSNVGGHAIADVDPAGIPAPRPAHCCPCIHTYPSPFTGAIVTVAPPVGYSTTFSLPFQVWPDRRPEPLVPPPIA
jgi:hypothetical protein